MYIDKDIIAAMFKRYTETASSHPIEYTYGFMDAMAVVREMLDEPKEF